LRSEPGYRWAWADQCCAAGVPKNLIEQAIARGQGRSTTGASLDVMTYEVMVPPSVALILDVETDNKMRALQDLNQTVK